MPSLELSFPSAANWATFAVVDAVFVQRPYKKDHLRFLQMAQSSGIPIWLDYDDDLFTVPTDNPAHEIYREDEVQKRMIECIRLANIVTVTTPALRKKLSQINGNVVTIPNAFNDLVFESKRPPIMARRHPLVLWRGSQTHVRDLMAYSAQIEACFRAHPQWTWSFIGYNPWFITDVLDKQRCIVAEPIDVMEYFEFLGRTQAAIQMVPLHDSPFNRAKSNIAMIEGAYAGSVTVAPAWEEWDVPGVLQYRNAKEFQDLMRLALSDEKFPFQQNAKLTWEWVLDNRRLSKLNQVRAEVLGELLEAKA